MAVDLKEKVRALRDTPGVYLMKDRPSGRIIYVGKAKKPEEARLHLFPDRPGPRPAPPAQDPHADRDDHGLRHHRGEVRARGAAARGQA
ncbi:MAG: hypothetical protein WDM96_01355 [Lacunisphaera sp.]